MSDNDWSPIDITCVEDFQENKTSPSWNQKPIDSNMETSPVLEYQPGSHSRNVYKPNVDVQSNIYSDNNLCQSFPTEKHNKGKYTFQSKKMVFGNKGAQHGTDNEYELQKPTEYKIGKSSESDQLPDLPHPYEGKTSHEVIYCDSDDSDKGLLHRRYR